jgi:predicted RNA-binding Zn-ribbon protein involved in translation (DUF1610 family)
MAVSSGRKTADKMTCPRCGAKMNHHCDKFVYGGGSLPHNASEIDASEIDASEPDATEPDATEPDATEIEPLFGGLIEFHACPNCGAAASRNA